MALLQATLIILVRVGQCRSHCFSQTNCEHRNNAVGSVEIKARNIEGTVGPIRTKGTIACNSVINFDAEFRKLSIAYQLHKWSKKLKQFSNNSMDTEVPLKSDNSNLVLLFVFRNVP